MTATLLRRFLLDRGSIFAATDASGSLVGAARSFEDVAEGRFQPDALQVLTDALETGVARPVAPTLPSKIVCVGLNYRAHAAEMNKALPTEPLLFLKPPSALLDPDAAIVIPSDSAEVHFEGELAVVIGKPATRVRASDAAAVIAGYTIMNDVTARDIQRRESHYTRAKGFDTFAPLGPAIVRQGDPGSFQLETRVNGSVRQRSGTDDLIFSVFELVEFISRVMTLLPGDVISTGTPAGVGKLEPGDHVSVEIRGIGVLANPVVAASN